MKTVKLSTNFPDWPLLRQTPACQGTWGDCRFLVNTTVETCDYWVVYEGLMGPDQTCCPPEHTIFICGEPPTIKKYCPAFLAQFSKIITCDRDLDHPGKVITHQAQPWHIGATQPLQSAKYRTYDDLAKENPYENKSRTISVICSDKQMTEGQRVRLNFVHELKTALGIELACFGRGSNPVADKYEAIRPFKYHIVLENSQINDYWTEKLADAYLGGVFPCYVGCPNLSDYFPQDSFVAFDATRPGHAVRAIKELIKADVFEKSRGSLSHARNLVLNRYNLFALLSDLCSGGQQGQKSMVAIHTEESFRPRLSSFRSACKVVTGAVRGLFSR